MTQPQYDAIVIGAGIIGCCIAYELAKRGRHCLVVDKLAGSGLGSTAASCAIIRLHYSTPQGVALAREGYYYWLDWKRYLKTPDPSGMAYYKNTGNLIFKSEVNHNLVNVKAALEEMGIGYRDLAPEEIPQFLPNPDLRAYHPQKRLADPDFGTPTGGRVPGAIYVPESGYISDPKQSTHNVEIAARAAGATFCFNAEVAEILQAKGRAAGIRLAGGEAIAAPVVVNVSGPHSHKINRMAGVAEKMRIKTRALRVEVVHVESPAGVNWEKDGVMLSDSDTGIYARPEVGNHWLIGSEEPACDALEYVDPDDYNHNFTAQSRAQVLRAGMRIPDLPIPNQPQGVVDLYDLSDDWYPIYDKSDLPGFYMAVGTSGNQYKNAPVVGAFMAELIDYCERGGDHDEQPLQYRMTYLKRSLDIGFFSRNREINRASSFSVIG
ncbi:MAG: FAD-dependent oxidoreductase [Desulfosarcinaceae bacterium]|nr:FAD-dependent oxidoreductase [Desulfosarcinaceae bacterium]